MTPPAPSSLTGPLFVLLSALCASTTGLFQALAPAEATPWIIAGCRMFTGAAAIALFLAVTGRRVSLHGWKWRWVFGYAAALLFFQLSFFTALPLIGVAVGTVVSIGTTPVFSGLFNWVLRRERPGGAWFVATAAALAGLWLVNDPGEASFSLTGLFFAVCAGACFAAELSIGRHLTESHGAEEAILLVMLLIGATLIPAFFVEPVAWILTPRGFAVAAALGVVTAAMNFVFMVEGLKTAAPPVAATLALAEPMGAALLGIFALGEPCTLRTLCGITAIFAAILLLIGREARKAKAGG